MRDCKTLETQVEAC